MPQGLELRELPRREPLHEGMTYAAATARQRFFVWLAARPRGARPRLGLTVQLLWNGIRGWGLRTLKH